MFFSVLMSVYNKEAPENLNNALLSIWDNQSIKPSEIVLVKDGPLTLQLELLIEDWKTRLQEKLVIVTLPQNIGLGAALNLGLKQCSSDLVARMDSDDISVSTRFEKQITFMEAHPDVDVSSGYIEEVSVETKEVLTLRKLPLVHADILKFAKSRCPISHPAVIFKKNVVELVGGYPELSKAQDVALWSLLLSKGYRFANVEDVLVRMGVGEDFYSRRGLEHLKFELKVLCFQKKIGFINIFQFSRNFLIRVFVRLVPTVMKKYLYKYARG